MDHWFDDFTRTLGNTPLTRRTMISWATKLGVAATGTALLGRFPATASAVELRAAPTTAAPCTVQDTYGVLKSVVSTSVPAAGTTPALTLTHTFLAEVGSGAAASMLTISPTSAPKVDAILRMTTSAAASRAGSAHASFGRLYTGGDASRAAFLTDGRTVSGFVDKRAAEPTPLGTDVKTVRFKDGLPLGTPFGNRPAPQASPPVGGQPALATPAGTSAVQQAVTALLGQARTLVGTCAVDSKASPQTAKCTQCQLTCRDAFLQCSVAAVQSSLASGPLAPVAYLGAANATCDAALQTCFRTCKSSGGCCPDYCKGDQTCCASAWGCCPPSANAEGKTWSKSWPTCPRCGPPPWPTARAATTPRPKPKR